MISIFRKLRKSFFGGHSANGVGLARYTAYAIGEIVLIVIGILIALKINNWNNFQNDRATEKTYLKELKADLQRDTTVLNQIIFNSIDGHIDHANKIIGFIDEREIEDSLSLARSLIRAGYMSFFDVNLSTYNELISSGSLKLIRSKEVKDLLSQYLGYIKQIEKRYEWNVQTVWYEYGNYIRKHYLDGRMSEKIFQDGTDLLQEYPISWDKMKDDQELKRLLTYVIGAGKAEKRWQSGTLRRANDLLTIIDQLLFNES